MIFSLKPSFLIFLSALIFLPFFASAQSSEEEIIRTFRVVALQSPIREVYYRSFDKDEQIISFPRRKTAEYTYKGPPIMVLYTLSTGPEGEIIRTPVGQFDFRSSSARDWVIFIAKRESKSNYAVIGYPAGSLTAPEGGGFSFVNLSSRPVIGLFGEGRIALKPGQTEILTRKDLMKSKDESSSQIQFAFKNENDWEPFFSSFWPVKEGRYSTIILFDNPEDGDVQVVRITEQRAMSTKGT